jgi:hypothetical protein
MEFTKNHRELKCKRDGLPVGENILGHLGTEMMLLFLLSISASALLSSPL